MGKILKAEQVAELLQISVAATYDLAAKKKIPSFKVGHLRRFDEEKIKAWMDQGGTNAYLDVEESTVIDFPDIASGI